jgi:anti-sigma regulatory factor (Ser/Thr protein kinase)
MPLSVVEMTLDGNIEELERLAQEVTRFCSDNDLDEDIEFALNLAFDELLVNAVKHGGCKGMKEAARVRIELLEDGVRAEFSDRGAEFDPTQVAPPDLSGSLKDRPIGGLGLHLVRNTMQDVQYRRDGGWNYVTMWRPV